MSLFKRKGRRISTLEDAEQDSASPGEEGSESAVQTPVRFGKRPNKQSALRRNTNVYATDHGSDASKEGGGGGGGGGDDDDDEDGPAVVRPTLGRTGSMRSKKRMSSSTRLSFGVGSEADGEDGSGVTTPRRTGAPSLSQRVLETNAFRKSLSGRLPTRPLEREDDDDSRPRYSKEYLDELQNSTPNTPRTLSEEEKKRGGYEEEDSMQLDASELEGAMVVDASELGTVAPLLRSAAPAAHVLTETEIQERKDRRARLALEQDAMALGSEDDEENGYISLLVPSDKKKRKEETRLVREDEDLGEGYDEFVEDGGLSLGRKAEREARRRRKQEMESLIRAAEGTGRDDAGMASGGGGGGADHPNDDSDDSEAERQAAYNAAQTRAGMDGLHRPGDDSDDDADDAATHGVGGTGAVSVPKMRPLPDFQDCLARMQRLVQGLEDEVTQRRKKLEEVEAEKAEILAREAEVQEILNKAGEKYQAILGTKPGMTPASLATGQSPLRPQALGSTERGLESLGGTPLRRTDADDA